MHHHAAEFEEFYASSSSKKKKYIDETLRITDLNIVLSKRLVTMITNKAPKAKVVVLYNAVNTYDKNPYNENAHNILFLGRLGKRKGTYDLLVAIKDLDKIIDRNIKFYICGDGDVTGVTEKIKEYGIEKRIEYIGWIDGKQKKEFMNNSMINVLPSYNEGLPMTILETMAYGIPNISTKIASIPEVIHDGEDGYIITPGDVEKLEECLKKLCINKELRKKISDKSWREITEKFAMDSHICQLKKYISEVV